MVDVVPLTMSDLAFSDGCVQTGKCNGKVTAVGQDSGIEPSRYPRPTCNRTASTNSADDGRVSGGRCLDLGRTRLISPPFMAKRRKPATEAEALQPRAAEAATPTCRSCIAVMAVIVDDGLISVPPSCQHVAMAFVKQLEDAYAGEITWEWDPSSYAGFVIERPVHLGPIKIHMAEHVAHAVRQCRKR